MRKTAFPLVFALLSCASSNIPPRVARPHYEMMGQDFCYREAEVESDTFALDKDLRLKELQFSHGDEIAVRKAWEDCQKDMESFFPTLPEKDQKKVRAACEFTRVEDYRKMSRTLAGQVQVACETRTEDLCHNLPIDSRKATRACIERNEPNLLRALALGKTSIEGIE